MLFWTFILILKLFPAKREKWDDMVLFFAGAWVKLRKWLKKKASARNDVPMRRNRFHSHLYQLQPFRINQNGPPFEASEQKVLSAHSWKSCSVRRSALLHPVVHQRVHPGRRDLPPPGKELGKLGNCRYAAVKQTNLKYQVFQTVSRLPCFFLRPKFLSS